jgi:hypothetical protein
VCRICTFLCERVYREGDDKVQFSVATLEIVMNKYILTNIYIHSKNTVSISVSWSQHVYQRLGVILSYRVLPCN